MNCVTSKFKGELFKRFNCALFMNEIGRNCVTQGKQFLILLPTPRNILNEGRGVLNLSFIYILLSSIEKVGASLMYLILCIILS